MTEQCVTLFKQDNIAFVTFNRAAKRNALDMAMFQTIDKVSSGKNSSGWICAK